MAERMLPYRPSTGANTERVNVGDADRWVSALIAATMLVRVRNRPSTLGKVLGILFGVMLAKKAATGRSRMYRMLGVSSAELDQGAGINIDATVTVRRPRAELYEFWHDPTNLPLVMSHVESVVPKSAGVTHWKVRSPGRKKVEWDSAIINESRYDYIAWHSLPGSDVEHSGSVHFNEVGDKGTEIIVHIRYVPSGVAWGFGVAKVLNPITEAAVAEDLRRFKHMMETGIDITTAGQPTGQMVRT